MRLTWSLLLLAPLALSVGANAPVPTPAGQSRDQCFWPSAVSGFSDAGKDKALVHLGARETWEIALSPGCPDVDYAMKIGIRARGGGRVCSGRDVELVVPEASERSGRRCLVRSVRKLSDAEATVARGLPPRR